MPDAADRDNTDPAGNQGLVWFCAHKYTAAIRNTSLTIEDLVQEGSIGLMRARKTFDPEKSKFSTYASWWIHNAMKRLIKNHVRTVRVPVHAQAGQLYRNWPKHPVPLYVKRKGRQSATTDSEDEVCILDLMRERFEQDPDQEEDFMSDESAQRVRRLVLEVLDDRERIIIRARFFEGKTLDQVGASLGGLSRERVRQLESAALQKMRAHARDYL